MSFTSFSFLFYFLPLALFSYAVCKKRFQKPLFILISLLFYAWFTPSNALYLIALIVYAYVGGRFIQGAHCAKITTLRTWIICSFLIFLLLYFKYAQGFYDALSAAFHSGLQIDAWLMPLGSSFIIFQVLSYIIDIGNHRMENASLTDCALYISFFPKLLMGPIMPYHRFQKVNALPCISWIKIENGVQRFTYGLAQKVILADSFALAYTAFSKDFSMLGSWLSSFAYTFQIFFDFTGYSSMAIGIAEMFGYHLDENFKQPYRAFSVRDFWRRWHISLSTWFRDYVYIPLGGNRVSNLKYIRNIMVVWLLTGMWHGNHLNFILWGLYYGIFILSETYVKPLRLKLPKPFTCLITFLIVNFGWVIFAHSDLSTLFHQIQVMFGFGTEWYSVQSISYLYSYCGLFVLAAVLVFVPYQRWKQKLYERFTWLEFSVNTVILLSAIAALVASQYQAFLYFQF